MWGATVLEFSPEPTVSRAVDVLRVDLRDILCDGTHETSDGCSLSPPTNARTTYARDAHTKQTVARAVSFFVPRPHEFRQS